jgi:hypothetical protein
MRRSHAIAVVLTSVTLLVFVRDCGNEFLTWDDGPVIYLNPHLNPATVEGLAWSHGRLDLSVRLLLASLT